MKKIMWIVVVVLVIAVSYVAAGPFLTVSAIKTGVAEQNSEKLSDNIEFSVLRQNLKDQLNVMMLENSTSGLEDNPFAALAIGLATKMVDGIVDSFVTPSGLAAIMKGKKPPTIKDTGSSTSTPKDDLFQNSRFSYDSINKFSIWVPDENGEESRFVLQRYGFSWKLVNIVIPIDEQP